MLQEVSLQNYNRTTMHFLSSWRDREEDLFDLNPSYQRGTVWTNEQRVALIKSLFMGIPTGTIITNHRGYHTNKIYAVVDGKQRIETIRAFHDSEFAVPAEWFPKAEVVETHTDEETGQEMVYLCGMTEKMRRGFESLPVANSEASVKGIEKEAEIFLLVNSGGTVQTEADLARASDTARGK